MCFQITHPYIEHFNTFDLLQVSFEYAVFIIFNLHCREHDGILAGVVPAVVRYTYRVMNVEN